MQRTQALSPLTLEALLLVKAGSVWMRDGQVEAQRVQDDPLGQQVRVCQVLDVALVHLLPVLALHLDVRSDAVLELARVFLDLGREEEARAGDDLQEGEGRRGGGEEAVSLSSGGGRHAAYFSVLVLEGLEREEAVEEHASRRDDDAVQLELLGQQLDEHDRLHAPIVLHLGRNAVLARGRFIARRVALWEDPVLHFPRHLVDAEAFFL